jgi:hypothetical protein
VHAVCRALGPLITCWGHMAVVGSEAGSRQHQPTTAVCLISLQMQVPRFFANASLKTLLCIVP